MAIDYLFVGVTFSFVMSLVCNVLGLEAGLNDENGFPRDVIYMFIATLASLETGWLLLGSGNAWMEAFFWLFFFLGVLDFCLLMFFGIQAMQIYRRRRRGWD